MTLDAAAVRDVLGHRSPVEEEHDLDPVQVLVVEWPDELPGFGGRVEVVDDDASRIPVFELRLTADTCADWLRANVPDLQLEVADCWRSFAAQTLLSDRDVEQMDDSEVEALIRRAYLFEATTLGAADALRQARDLAARIVAGWDRRFRQAIGEAA